MAVPTANDIFSITNMERIDGLFNTDKIAVYEIINPVEAKEMSLLGFFIGKYSLQRGNDEENCNKFISYWIWFMLVLPCICFNAIN